jgi:hypothetical protein
MEIGSATIQTTLPRMLLELSRSRTQDARPMPIAAQRHYV